LQYGISAVRAAPSGTSPNHEARFFFPLKEERMLKRLTATSALVTLLFGSAAAFASPVFPLHAAQHVDAQQTRRVSLYRAWYYRRYGEYPSAQQFRDWYYATYGVHPS
jgi:hypothetical protein